jgi:hypothetical protein
MVAATVFLPASLRKPGPCPAPLCRPAAASPSTLPLQ